MAVEARTFPYDSGDPLLDLAPPTRAQLHLKFAADARLEAAGTDNPPQIALTYAFVAGLHADGADCPFDAGAEPALAKRWREGVKIAGRELDSRLGRTLSPGHTS